MTRRVWIVGVALSSLTLYLSHLYGVFSPPAAMVTESIWILLTWIIVYPDAAMKASSLLYGALGRWFIWADRRSVSNYIQGAVNEASRSINADCQGILPHGIQIKWVTTKDRDAFIKDGKVIVCMEKHINEARNLARAAFLYVSEGLIPESQTYVDKTVMDSSIFTTARKILTSERKSDAMKILNEDFLVEAQEKNLKLKSYIIGMEQADAAGLFTRVLLRELKDLGPRLYPQLSSPSAEKETRMLADKIIDLVTKPYPGKDVSPDVKGEVIRVSIMQVAREEILPYDVGPYMDFARRCATEAIDTLYVVARGDKIFHANLAVRQIEAEKLYKVSDRGTFVSRRGKKATEAMVTLMTRYLNSHRALEGQTS